MITVMHIYLWADGNTKRADKRGKGVITKTCAPFTDYISKINNTQTDNTNDIDVLM